LGWSSSEPKEETQEETWIHNCDEYSSLQSYISSNSFQKRSFRYKKWFFTILDRVRENPMSLNGGGHGFIRNKFIVLEAVSKNGLAIRWMSGYLNNDKDIIKTAVRQNSEAMLYINEIDADVSKDVKFLAYLVRNCGLQLEHVHESLQKEVYFIVYPLIWIKKLTNIHFRFK
jgi:hypothetical protein